MRKLFVTVFAFAAVMAAGSVFAGASAEESNSKSIVMGDSTVCTMKPAPPMMGQEIADSMGNRPPMPPHMGDSMGMQRPPMPPQMGDSLGGRPCPPQQ